MVVGSVAAEDGPILEKIFEQIQDYQARTPARKDGSQDLHGFTEWVLCLYHGFGSLPERLPTAFLTAWRDGYEPSVGWNGEPRSPVYVARCEGCKLILPNRDAKGEWGGFDVCPACGGTQISGRSFAHVGKWSLDGGRTVFE
jgi:hypothetical protein